MEEPGEHGLAWRLVLVALTCSVTLQAFRVLFPEVYGWVDRSRIEVVAVAVAVVAVFATPFLVVPLRRFGEQRALIVAVLVLASWRVVVLLPATVPLGLAVAGGVVSSSLLGASRGPSGPGVTNITIPDGR